MGFNWAIVMGIQLDADGDTSVHPSKAAEQTSSD